MLGSIDLSTLTARFSLVQVNSVVVSNDMLNVMFDLFTVTINFLTVNNNLLIAIVDLLVVKSCFFDVNEHFFNVKIKNRAQINKYFCKNVPNSLLLLNKLKETTTNFGLLQDFCNRQICGRRKRLKGILKYGYKTDFYVY